MDYTSFWKGTLTRQDWEAQRHSRCEDMVNKDLYESLTKDAFKGAHKNESDEWGLALSVRSSTVSFGDLELTWAGSVTNTIAGRSLQQKTILGTMNLEKVDPEESKAILKQWIKTTIEERQKFEHLSSSLKAHVVGLDRQYQECKELLVDFKLDKRRSQNDLLEKFRALINTKKEKIVKLVNLNNSLQSRMELLEKALKEERRKVAGLEGKEIEDTDTNLADIKKQEDSENDEKHSNVNARGRGRGRGGGRGRGRGRAIKVEHGSEGHTESANLVISSRKKPMKVEKNTIKSQDFGNSDIDTPQPLPHPQDGYGWDEDDDGILPTKNEDEDEEPLMRKFSRNNKRSSSTMTPVSDAISEPVKNHLEDLSASAQDLISRVSKAASTDHLKDQKRDIKRSPSTSLRSSPTKKGVKREESDQADFLLGHRIVQETNIEHELDLSSHSPKRHKVDKSIGEGSSNRKPNLVTPLSHKTRHPVISMRRTAAKVVVDRNSLDIAPQSPLSRSSSADGSAPLFSIKRSRSSMILESPRKADHRRTKDITAVASASIISEEDLYKELE
ncbi:hypothetical protein BGZ49_004768 [Haplosporangium sp. Z 27]|nr:hypothetical protein BGZ49_004768 [Haplosporangium sp. Z 27]